MNSSRLALLAICMIVTPLLSGCLGGGGGGSSSSGSGGSGSGGDSTYASSFSSPGGSTTGGSTVSSAVHNPEPATIALFGGGLIAYALSRRKKKK